MQMMKWVHPHLPHPPSLLRPSKPLLLVVIPLFTSLSPNLNLTITDPRLINSHHENAISMNHIFTMNFIIIKYFRFHACTCRAVITITWWRMFRNPACGVSSLRKQRKFWRRISHPQTHTTTPPPPKNSKHTLSIHFLLLSYVIYFIDSC